MNNLLRIALRQNAIFIPSMAYGSEHQQVIVSATRLLINLSRLGFCVTEPLYEVLNRCSSVDHAEILSVLRDVMGVNKNWASLDKDWEYADEMDRFKHSPFNGKPYVFGRIENFGQGSKLKVLELWTERNCAAFLEDLPGSKTPLDATQTDSLKMLLSSLPVPAVKVGMKETLMMVVDECISQGKAAEAGVLFSSPAEILRYLWYKHTGFLQIVEPKTLTRRKGSNAGHITFRLNQSAVAKLITKAELKLKYNRMECRMVASWLNALPGNAESLYESMHPKRAMWVRFIRALRLAEYAQREGFERLRLLMNVFYHTKHENWQGLVNYYRLHLDADATFYLLQERPGLFTRSLFANMLWFGAEPALAAFAEIADKVPSRLLFMLSSYAGIYFDPSADRVVKTLGGVNKRIGANSLLNNYSEQELDLMKARVTEICLRVMKTRFAAVPTSHRSIYIDPRLFDIPMAIGDRPDTVQDVAAAPQGTRFPVEGDKLRLFMQWGVGLPAQHLDMDLSCQVLYATHTETCSYSSLVITGCKHSGDVRYIPAQKGTAEYIEMDMTALKKAKANYVIFTSNAYSSGAITPNLVIGWMNSRYSMRVSEKTGVAYDPSCVQHQVRVVNSISKGLVFGVLDVNKAEITWMEMSFFGQVTQNLDNKGVMILLKRFGNKLSIGQVLRVKAEAQGLEIRDQSDADEVYTKEWAANMAAVSQLLVD